MKKLITLFLILLSILFIQKAASQPSLYTEQTSGVSSGLNSVSVPGENNYPSQAWICGDSGVVLKTTNTGVNWSRVGVGIIPINMKLVNINCRALDTVLVTGIRNDTAFVFRTVNSGTNWAQVFSQPGGRINAIWMRNSLSGFMTGDPVGGRWSLWKTTSGGQTWDSTGLYLVQAASEKGFPNSLSMIGNVIWFGTNNTRLYRSSNNGANWLSVSTGAEVNSTAVWSYWDTTLSTFTMFGGSNAFKSTNNGQNWSMSSVPDTGKFRGFCAAYYAVLDNQPMAIHAVRNNSRIYIAEFGSNNFTVDYTAPAGLYNHMALDGSRLYWLLTWAVRSNGGITRISLLRGGSVRSLSNVIPTGYRLEQNYPNPFNPETKIRFNIPRFKNTQSGMVSIIIYDVQGREVDRALNQAMNPGEYELSYNASKLCSDVYFYRLTTENFTQSMKMILIK